MPFDLYKAVEHAMTIIHWQENLGGDEMPPEWMWSVAHELEIWFERLEAEREEKYGGSSRTSTSGRDERVRVPLADNELAREMRAR